MLAVKDWNIEEITGYKPKTTFYTDFSIADRFGVKAVMDTYKRGLKTAKALGVEYLTEFVMVLNWKAFEHNTKSMIYTKLYSDLYYKADDYCRDLLKGDDLRYYYKTLD